ncbi:hypothetical protein VTJ83DRAFT_1841 [Remersonia thermophila]|uniref:Uncharacterized protein n=1 Tax=Remersonia thermophila TaxID=72144 RepID=A0ABR4DJD2_9PEZI
MASPHAPAPSFLLPLPEDGLHASADEGLRDAAFPARAGSPDSAGSPRGYVPSSYDGDNLDCLHNRLCESCYQALVERVLQGSARTQESHDARPCTRSAWCRTWKWLRQACSRRSRKETQPSADLADDEGGSGDFVPVDPPASVELPSVPAELPAQMPAVEPAELDPDATRAFGAPNLGQPNADIPAAWHRPRPSGSWNPRPTAQPSMPNLDLHRPGASRACYPGSSIHDVHAPGPLGGPFVQAAPAWAPRRPLTVAPAVPASASPSVVLGGPAAPQPTAPQAPWMGPPQPFAMAMMMPLPGGQYPALSRPSMASVSTLTSTAPSALGSWHAVPPPSSTSSAPVCAPPEPSPTHGPTAPLYATHLTSSPRMDGEDGGGVPPPMGPEASVTGQSSWSAVDAVAGAGMWAEPMLPFPPGYPLGPTYELPGNGILPELPGDDPLRQGPSIHRGRHVPPMPCAVSPAPVPTHLTGLTGLTGPAPWPQPLLRRPGAPPLAGHGRQASYVSAARAVDVPEGRTSRAAAALLRRRPMTGATMTRTTTTTGGGCPAKRRPRRGPTPAPTPAPDPAPTTSSPTAASCAATAPSRRARRSGAGRCASTSRPTRTGSRRGWARPRGSRAPCRAAGRRAATARTTSRRTSARTIPNTV